MVAVYVGLNSSDKFSVKFAANESSFGPSSDTLDVLAEAKNRFPFLPLPKFERFGKAADFSLMSYNRAIREGYLPPGFDEDAKFHTVDTGRVIRRHEQGGGGVLAAGQSNWHKRKTPKQTTQAFQQKQEQERLLLLGKKRMLEKKKQQATLQARFQKLNMRIRAGADWSVEPQTSWTSIGEIVLQNLAKKEINLKSLAIQDICWRGKVLKYLKEMDKINPKTCRTVKVSANERLPITTGDDSIIQACLCKNDLESFDINSETLPSIDVVATDQILAAIMCSPSSRLSWHIWIHKIEGKLIFDKSDGSTLDLLTVNETSQDPPRNEVGSKVKGPAQLGQEALRISNSIRNQLLNREADPAYEYPPPPPECEDRDEDFTVAYRYRIFTVPGRKDRPEGSDKPINILARTEVHGASEKKLLGICILPELDSRSQQGWKHALEAQKGAVLVTELRNNANRIQRFTACSYLGGAEESRIAFVTRKTQLDPDSYSLLFVQTHNLKDLSKQIGFDASHGWGAVRFVVDCMEQMPDGRYALVKDPQKQNLRVYRIGEGIDDVEESEGVSKNVVSS